MRSLVLATSVVLASALAWQEPARSAPIYKLSVNEIIHRVSAKYVTDGIERADRENAALVLIQLQTPGGLDTSMREIIEKILNSKTPVVVYVAPSGARAASAGFVITLAADVAAMSPGTNMGAAHPVSAGGEPMDETMSKKVESDAAAYVRSLAAKRGRNVELAEKGVVESKSWTEKEALEQGLIDYVASSEADLLAQLDGKTITKFDGTKIRVVTAGQPVVEISMSWPQKILSAISHPNVAYVLMALGMLGLYFELANPGAVLPGVIGAISLILAFFALQVLPVNIAGLLLIVVGIGLIIAEAFTAGFGALGVGGLVALFLGSLILFEQPTIPTPALQVSWSVLVPVAVVLALMFSVLARMVIVAQRRKAATGQEGLIGEVGVAQTDFPGDGKVFVHGEYWNARSKDKLGKGDRVRVTKVEGLTVTVEPAREVS